MKGKNLNNPVGREAEVKRREWGGEYVELNAFAAAYYRSRDNFAQCTLATETSARLPLVGYLLPSIYGEKYLQRDRPCGDGTHIFINGFVPAVQITVDGNVAKDDYAAGSRVRYSVGLLYFPAINAWNACVDIREPWTVSLWEKLGLDFRLFLRRYWFLQDVSKGKDRSLAYSLETMEMESPIDFENLLDVPLQIICDLLQIDAHGASALSRSLRQRVNSITLGEWQEAINAGKHNVFTEIRNVTEQLSQRLKRLLLVAMLHPYWTAHSGKDVSRADNLMQLGLASELSGTTLWNYRAEAGCIPSSKSMILKKLQGIQNQARFYFDGHPQELAKLQAEIELEREFHQKEIADDSRQDPLMRWGMTINLPPDQRRNRSRV